MVDIDGLSTTRTNNDMTMVLHFVHKVQATTKELYHRFGLITCETIYDGGRGRSYWCDKEGLERHGRRLRCR